MWGSLGVPPSFLVGDHWTESLLGKQTALAFCLRQAESREEGKNWAAMVGGWGTCGGWAWGWGTLS